MPDCTGYLPGISGGLQSLLLDPSTLSSLYGAMGTSSGAFLALSQLPGINMDAVQVPTSHAAPKLMAAACESPIICEYIKQRWHGDRSQVLDLWTDCVSRTVFVKPRSAFP